MEPAELSYNPVLPSYCVPSRCRLCRFPIAHDATVVADVDGRLSSRFSYNSIGYHQAGNRRSSVRACSAPCHHEDGQVPGYHAECIEFASYHPSRAFLHATDYAFEPMPSEDQRRFSRIRYLVAERLYEDGGVLPIHVHAMIASALVRECAISTMLELWRARRSYDSDVDISFGVWADYIYIDGVRYVASLSNTADPKHTRLLDASAASNTDVVYVLEDHIGVRQLVFTSPGRTSKLLSSASKNPRMGLWWRTIPLCSWKKLTAESDGLKLRSIRATPSDNSTILTWSTPTPPSSVESLRFWTLVPTSRLSDVCHFRMASMNCNDPAINGYSVCWATSLMTLHAHLANEDVSFYRDFEGHCHRAVWIYMPVGPGELVTEIWARRGRQSRHTGLMFRTNKERLVMMAIRIPPRMRREKANDTSKWKPLCSLPASLNRVYFSLSSRGIDRIATQHPVFRRVSPVSLTTLSPYPESYGAADYFYSAANLDSVVEITPCQRNLSKYSPIVGLLFHYADGGRACVGEFRMDCASETLRVDTSDMLHLGFAGEKEIPSHVAKIGPRSPQDGTSLSWLSVPWTGKLEWWFNFGHCKVYHDGEQNLST